MLMIAICDDDKQTLSLLESKVKSCLIHLQTIATIVSYSDSRLLKYDIQDNKHFDLILSDIQMPHINGMELARYIKMHLPDAIIIFVTAHLKYAIDAFELSIFRYIPKKLLHIKLLDALTEAIQFIQFHDNQCYIIYTSTKLYKIFYNRILYIQRDGKNSVFALTDGTTIHVRKSLIQVFRELPSQNFFYINRGSIVNLAHVIGIRKDGRIELNNGTKLPTSKVKLDQLKEQLNLFWNES